MATNPDDIADVLDPSRYERVQSGEPRQATVKNGDADPVTEDVLRALNVDTWMSGLDMSNLEARMEQEIELAVRNEEEIIPLLRARLERGLRKRQDCLAVLVSTALVRR